MNTRFLYEAAMKSERILTPKGEEISVHPLIAGDASGVCAFRSCGHETKDGHERVKVIKKTFTDHSYLTDSPAVCEYCVWALGAAVKDAAQGGVRWLRNYSLYAGPHGLELPARARLRELFVSRPSTPYLVCVAVSGQKWLHFKASVGRSRAAWQVMFEERRLSFSPQAFARLTEPMETLYRVFNKDHIRSGDYRGDPGPIGGEDVVERLERRISPLRGSDLFELAVSMAQKHEIPTELEKGEVCTTVSEPRTKSAQSQLF